MQQCTTCGSTLDGEPVNGHHRCAICGHFEPVAPEESLGDHVADLGREPGVSCPHCDSLLRTGVLDATNVLHCRDCGGLLLDAAAFNDLVRRRRTNYAGPDDRPTPLNPAEYERETHCPRCESRMDVHPYHGPGNCIIDSCPHCNLVWLDQGEIGVIERAPGVR